MTFHMLAQTNAVAFGNLMWSPLLEQEVPSVTSGRADYGKMVARLPSKLAQRRKFRVQHHMRSPLTSCTTVRPHDVYGSDGNNVYAGRYG
jgi:hypothetical protein